MLFLRALYGITQRNMFYFLGPWVRLCIFHGLELARGRTATQPLSVTSVSFRHWAPRFGRTDNLPATRTPRLWPLANALAIDEEALQRLEWLASKQPSLAITANLNESPARQSG